MNRLASWWRGERTTPPPPAAPAGDPPDVDPLPARVGPLPAAEGPRRPPSAPVAGRPGDVLIRRGDRITIIGRTGSGKSVALRYLVATYSRAVLVDPKGRAVMDGWPVVYGVDAFRAAWPAAPRVIARPGPAEDRSVWLDAVCRVVYHAGETALAVDEIVGLASSTRPSRWLDAVLTQGRELGITAIVCTQRPRRIPPTVLSEADHILVYALNRDDDRRAVAEVIGDYPAPAFGSWRFVYWSARLTDPIESPPLPIESAARG